MYTEEINYSSHEELFTKENLIRMKSVALFESNESNCGNFSL